MILQEPLPTSPKDPSERTFGTQQDDQEVYNALSEMMDEGQHGIRWSCRDFTDDPHELLRIDKAFIPILDQGVHAQKAARDWAPFLIPQDDLAELQKGIGSVYDRSDVSTHLANGGTLVFLLTPHLTYADLPVCMGAAALVSPKIAQNQTGFIHRQVVLEELRGEPDENGQIAKLKVVDDGLMLIGNTIQTLPDSKSGRDDRLADSREAINGAVQRAIDDLLELGGQTLWLAGSGTETKFDPVTGKNVVGLISRNNARLLYMYNARRSNKVMTVPLSIQIDPFTSEGGFNPHLVPFSFGEPKFLHSKDEARELMEREISTANSLVQSGTPPFRNETPEEFITRVGKRP